MAFTKRVSEEFKAHEQIAANVVNTAAQAELGASNSIDLAVGSKGKCTFSGLNAGMTKPKPNAPSKPYTIVELQIVEPESHKGRKVNRYFDFGDHPQYSQEQKYGDYFDFIQLAGCPTEIRRQGKAAMEAWMETAPVFDFEVAEGYGGRRQINPYTPASNTVPTGSATSAALAAANTPTDLFKVSQAVLFAGQVMTISKIIDNNVLIIKNPTNGMEQTVTTDQVKSV